MKLITSSELARLKGVSKQAVSKAIKNGKLISRKKGTSICVDLHNKLTKIYLSTTSNQELNERVKRVQDDSITRKKELKETRESTEEKKWAKIRSENLDAKRMAELSKINAAAQKMNIEIAEKTGELIPRDTCEQVFGNISKIIVNYFFTLGERLAPEVLAICEISDSKKRIAVQKKIDDEVQRCLKEFKAKAKIK